MDWAGIAFGICLSTHALPNYKHDRPKEPNLFALAGTAVDGRAPRGLAYQTPQSTRRRLIAARVLL